MAEEESSWQAILDFLENFRRPSAALWTGISSAGTDEGFLGGAKRGFMLEPGAKELADVIGLEEGRPEDDWAPWLGKEGLRLGANLIGDPLTYLFAPAKAKGIIGPAIKALGIPEGRSIVGHAASPATQALAKSFESSDWFKTFGHRLSTAPEFEEGLQRVGREGGEAVNRVRRLADDMNSEMLEFLDQAGGKYKAADVFHAIEEGTTDPELKAMADYVRPLWDTAMGKWKEKNDLREFLPGFTPHPGVTMEEGRRFMPRVATDAAVRKALRVGESSVDPAAWSDASREIFRWLDPEGNVVKVGKLDQGIRARPNPETGVTEYFLGDKPVTRSQASLADVQKVVGEDGRTFESNPITALTKYIGKQQSQINMLKILQAAQEGQSPLMKFVGHEAAPEGMRLLRPLEEGSSAWSQYAADPRVANRMENMMGIGTGLIDDFLGKVTDSKIGRVSKQLQDWWKSEVLLNTGFFGGNAISNVGLLYNDGVNAANILPRIYDAIKVRTKSTSKVFDSWNNADLLRFAEDSGLTKSGWAGTLEKRPFGEVIEDFYPEKLGKATVQKGADTWDWFKQKAFKALGVEPEDNAKLARWIDYIKETAPNFDTLTPAEQIKIMDRGILRAKDALVDYTNLAPTERKAQFFAPFLAWSRGITGLTLEQAVTSPQKFAQTARFLDTVFEPLPPEDKANADPWIKEQSPVTGFMGGSFGTDERGNDQMLLLNRYLPQGNIEQMLKRPGDYLKGATSPLLKVPIESLTNWSSMKDKPIDPLAKGTLAQYWAPILDMMGRDSAYSPAQNRTLGMELPAGWDYLLQQSPAGRHVKTVNDLTRSLGAFEDPYKPQADTSLPNKVGSAVAQTLTGSRFYGFDPQKYAHKRKVENDKYIRQIKSSLKYAGMVGDDYGVEHYQALLAAINEEPGRFLEGGF